MLKKSTGIDIISVDDNAVSKNQSRRFFRFGAAAHFLPGKNIAAGTDG